MKTNRFYKILIAVLVILNGVTLYFLWKAPGHFPPHGHRPSLVEKLELSGKMANSIKKLEDQHFKDKDALINKSRKLHEQLFRSFNDSSKDINDINNLIDKIVENQRETEQMTFDYFKEVDALCNPDQKKKLQNAIHHALGRMGMPPPPKK